MHYNLFLMAKDLNLDAPLDGGLVLSVLLAGFGVVFFALIILVLFISGMGSIFTADKKKSVPELKTEPQPAATAPIVSIKPDEDSDEVIAVISAAVAMMSQEDGKVYKVKSVTPSATVRTRNAWGAAGVRDNTTPF